MARPDVDEEILELENLLDRLDLQLNKRSEKLSPQAERLLDELRTSFRLLQKARVLEQEELELEALLSLGDE